MKFKDFMKQFDETGTSTSCIAGFSRPLGSAEPKDEKKSKGDKKRKKDEDEDESDED